MSRKLLKGFPKLKHKKCKFSIWKLMVSFTSIIGKKLLVGF
jgi:hypothetical protein